MSDRTPEARQAIGRLLAVSQFSSHGYVDDAVAHDAGYWTEPPIDQDPWYGNILYGPDDDWPATGCRFVRDAWSEFDLSVAATASYQRQPNGLDSAEVTMLLPPAAASDELVEMTIGVNDRLGLYADPLSIEALGGRRYEPVGDPNRINTDTGMPMHLQNLADSGVGEANRHRIWTALNEMVQTHPEISLAYGPEHKPRNLPDHRAVDQAVLGRDAASLEPEARPQPARAAAAGVARQRAVQSR